MQKTCMNQNGKEEIDSNSTEVEKIIKFQKRELMGRKSDPLNETCYALIENDDVL